MSSDLTANQIRLFLIFCFIDQSAISSTFNPSTQKWLLFLPPWFSRAQCAACPVKIIITPAIRMLKYSVSTYSKIFTKNLVGTAHIIQFQQQNARHALNFFHYFISMFWPRCFSLSSSPLLGIHTKNWSLLTVGIAENFMYKKGQTLSWHKLFGMIFRTFVPIGIRQTFSGTDLLAKFTILFNFCKIMQCNVNFGGHAACP